LCVVKASNMRYIPSLHLPKLCVTHISHVIYHAILYYLLKHLTLANDPRTFVHNMSAGSYEGFLLSFMLCGFGIGLVGPGVSALAADAAAPGMYVYADTSCS
jgi:hypothetical protein